MIKTSCGTFAAGIRQIKMMEKLLSAKKSKGFFGFNLY